MAQLVQKKGFHYQAYELRDEDMKVHIRDFDGNSEYHIDYTELGLRTYYHAARIARIWQWMLWAFIVAVTIVMWVSDKDAPLLNVQWGTVLILLALLGQVWILLKQEPARIYLTGGERRIDFLADLPDSTSVNDFIEETCGRIREAHYNQYLSEYDELSYEEKRARIIWLHEMKVIDRDVREDMLSAISPGRGIGFGKYLPQRSS
ncbi:MAG: hypothetical protein R2795_11475 [Saprospiraceae bacterium]